MKTLAKYSFGVGDRFAHQAGAQLTALMQCETAGTVVVPVWNKSHREHTTIGSQPGSVRAAADAAVETLGWRHPYHVDADHIRLDTVDGFIESSDFYTIDVADSIGGVVAAADIEAFMARHPELSGRLAIDGIEEPLEIASAEVRRIAAHYLPAVQQAAAIYCRIEAAKGADNFITEVSMDETESPQQPHELLIILAALADAGVPVQTIAPKFSGRFNKGVDYVGDVARFEREFNDDVAVIGHATGHYALPRNLKLSVHSGSDKFSIYAPIRRALARFDSGLHLKTAGTTWLEEVIGLAEAGGEGLQLAKAIYAGALEKREVLCAPYAAVIDIDPALLPAAATVAAWEPAQFTAALRHDQGNPQFNPHLRQLIHVGYKIAAQMGQAYLHQLQRCEPVVARNVTENLYERHLRPLFVGASEAGARP